MRRGLPFALALVAVPALAQTWSDAGTLLQSRSLHSATLMSDGRVLVAGGHIPSTTINLASSELFDPLAARWSIGPTLQAARSIHSAIRLWDGRILLVGGHLGALAEAYDPRLQTFVDAGFALRARHDLVTSLTPSGDVWIAGGRGSATVAAGYAEVERYDTRTRTFATGPTAGQHGTGGCSLRLTDGSLMILGGEQGVPARADVLFDDGGVTTPFSMETSAAQHGCFRIGDDTALLVHGDPTNTDAGTTVLSFDLNSGSVIAGWNVSPTRFDGAHVLAANGTPMWLGGVGATANVEFFVDGGVVQGGSLASWTTVSTLTVLPTGRILLVPGDQSGAPATLLIDVRRDTFTSTTPLPGPRAAPAVVALPDGRVYVAGGHDDADQLSSALLYEPTSGSWLDAGNTRVRRNGAGSTLLLDGQVLVVGGSIDGGSLFLTDAYRFDPETNQTRAVAPIPVGQPGLQLSLEQDGTVLALGGSIDAGTPGLVHRYDPFTDGWTAEGTIRPRSGWQLVRMPAGELLAVSGDLTPGAGTTIDRLLPDAGRDLLSVPFMPWRRQMGVSVLPNGQLFLVAGDSGGGLRRTDSAIFDLVNNSVVAGPTGLPRTEPVVMRLRSGHILIGGGDVVQTAALYDPVAGRFSPVSPPLGQELRSSDAVRLLTGAQLFFSGEELRHGAEASLYDEGVASSQEVPWLHFPCLSAAPGVDLAFVGAGLWASRQSSGGVSQSSPDDLLVVAFEAWDTGFITYGHTVVDSLSSGHVRVPKLRNGWYRVYGIVRGSPGPAQALRIGWEEGTACRDPSQCGGKSCANGLCLSSCAPRPQRLNGPGFDAGTTESDGGSPLDGGASTDGGAVADGGTSQDPKVLRVGCGCASADGLWALFWLAPMGSWCFRRRRPRR